MIVINVQNRCDSHFVNQGNESLLHAVFVLQVTDSERFKTAANNMQTV